MSYEADLKLFIDGVWKSGEGRDAHTVINPVTGGGIAEVPYATEADLEEALTASQRAWPEWRSTDVEKRAGILHKTADLLKERADHIGQSARLGERDRFAGNQQNLHSSALLTSGRHCDWQIVLLSTEIVPPECLFL